VSRLSILIVLCDSMAAALIGATVELAGHVAQFAAPDEPARAALRRTRPRVVIIDSDHEERSQDAVIGPSLMTGARVILVRTPHSRGDARTLAEHPDVVILDLPAGVERLAALLQVESLGESLGEQQSGANLRE
jgi:hypothetical protein